MDLLNNNNPVLVPGQRLIQIKGGYAAAEKYPMPRDCWAPLFDEDEDVLFIKITDTNGAATIRMFDMTERAIPVFDPAKYVTIDDFKSFKEEILNGINTIQQSISTGQSNNRNSNSGKQLYKPNTDSSQSTGSV